MRKAPMISIVTPSYNQGRFIAETIESVLSQEGDFHIEYIVMDGGGHSGVAECFYGIVKKSILAEKRV